MNSGSWQSILYELKYGSVFTVLDELWHAVDWFLPSVHWRFCQWTHNKARKE